MPLALTPLVITRPIAQARAWQASLQPLLPARTCHVLPLIEIAPPSAPLRQGVAQCWQMLAQFHAAVFVSPAAVEHFFAAQPHAIQPWQQHGVRAWAVGAGTRQALLHAGVAAHAIDSPPDDAPQFDSEALWPLVQPQLAHCARSGKRILRVRGADAPACAASKPSPLPLGMGMRLETCRTSGGTAHAVVPQAGNGRDWLGAAIQQVGVGLHSVAAYCRQRPVWSERQMQEAQALAQAPAVWLFSSSLAVQHLAASLPAWGWAQASALTTHPRIAEHAQALGFGQVLTTRPTVADVVRCLQSCP